MVFGLRLRRLNEFKTRHLVLLMIAVLLMRTGVNYMAYGLTGDWLIKNNDQTRFMMMNAGIPDSYGNRIAELEILQDTGGGTWISRGTANYTNYTANMDISAIQNQTTRFVVTTWLNYSFASSQSAVYDRVLITLSVTGELTNINMTIDDITLNGTYNYIIEASYDWEEENKPAITSYDVYIRFNAWGFSGVDNTQDLTEQNQAQEYFYDHNTLAEALWSELAMTVPQARDYLYHMGGVWGVKTDGHGYFQSAGFFPLDNAESWTVDSWFMCTDITATGYDKIWSEYVNGTDYAILQQYQDDLELALRYQGTYYNAIITGYLQNYVLYYASSTYSASTGNLTLTLYDVTNSTFLDTDTEETGLSVVLDLPEMFTIGARHDDAQQFIGFQAHTNIYNRNMTRTESDLIFTGGIGFVYDTTGLNNSWSFDEYANYGYGFDEQTLHDGIGVIGLRELWTVDLVSVSYASFLFPWPNSEPVFWIWLIGGVCGIIAVPIILATKMKDTDNKFKLLMIGFIVLSMAWALFTGLS